MTIGLHGEQVYVQGVIVGNYVISAMGEYFNVYTIQWYEYELLHFARCG